jgi:hypothetical protein
MMEINYWDCKFHDYDEAWDGECETRIYGCSHPDNAGKYCNKDNKWFSDEAECLLAQIGVTHDI